jgi:hypothetical protein
MNILKTLVLILLSTSLSNCQLQTEPNQETVRIEEPEIIKGIIVRDEDYTLHFDIEKIKDQKYNLVVAIELHNEAYYISPNTEGDFSGKFNMGLGSYNNLGFEGDIVESPRSVEEFDGSPFDNGTVNWVHEYMTYKQSIQIKSQEDFEVLGKIKFTIEPRCTFEEISFAISYQDGEMKINYPKC